MPLFNVPYLAPQFFQTGTQVFNPGAGGPASHIREQTSVPRIYPTVFMVGTMGLGNMPRQVLGPTPVVAPNTYAGNQQALLIPGLQKKG